ncbi:MAG TPA: hypothetical protein VGC66_12920 [Pyrinomonadaceae bacterium]|jgi:hypothetical protein
MIIKRVTSAFILGLILSFAVVVHAQESEPPFMLRAAFSRLKALDSVTSSSVGFAAMPGKFFLLSQDFMKYGSVPFFKELLKNEKPVVRVMGLVCLAQTLSTEEYAEILEAHKADCEEVRYTRGCIGGRATVGQIAQWLKDDPYFFGRESGKEPSS